MASRARIPLGMSLPHRSPDVIGMDEVRQVAQRAEALGFGDLWVTENTLDHVMSFDPAVVLTYAAADGSPAAGRFPDNPNGSVDDIAGICDATGLVCYRASNIVVVLAPGATLTGSVSFETTRSTTPPDATQLRVAIQPADQSTFGGPSNARVEKDGRFTLVGVPIGQHWIRAQGQRGWILKSVVVDGREMIGFGEAHGGGVFAKDGAPRGEIVVAGRAFLLSYGTRVEVIERTSSAVRIRVREGAREGQDGWVPNQWVKR